MPVIGRLFTVRVDRQSSPPVAASKERRDSLVPARHGLLFEQEFVSRSPRL